MGVKAKGRLILPVLLLYSVRGVLIPERNARQDIHRQDAERLALMGRAESVRQSLPGMRSWQSQPHGCYQMSGLAAGVKPIQVKNIKNNTATNAKSFSASQYEDAEEQHQSTDQYPR